MKNILTIVLVIIALFAAYIFLGGPARVPKQDSINTTINITTNETSNITINDIKPGSRVPIESDVFLDELEAAQGIALVQDIRNVNNAEIRRNILQCGTDFAGSSEFGYLMQVLERNVTIYALEESSCTMLDGVFDLDMCVGQINAADIVIHIQAGSQYAFYRNKLVVGVDKGYSAGACSISRVLPSQPAANQTGNESYTEPNK